MNQARAARHRQDPRRPRPRAGRLPEGSFGRLRHRGRAGSRAAGGDRRAPAPAPAEAAGGLQAADRRRARLCAAITQRGGVAVRGVQPALRAGLGPGHQQPALRRMDIRVRRGAAHRCAPRPAHPPRPHPRDERRELPPEGQPKAPGQDRDPNQRHLTGQSTNNSQRTLTLQPAGTVCLRQSGTQSIRPLQMLRRIIRPQQPPIRKIPAKLLSAYPVGSAAYNIW